MSMFFMTGRRSVRFKPALRSRAASVALGAEQPEQRVHHGIHREYRLCAAALIAAQQPQFPWIAEQLARREHGSKRSRILQAEVQALAGQRMNHVASVAREDDTRRDQALSRGLRNG